MKRQLKKGLAILAMATLAVGSIAGCKHKTGTNDADTAAAIYENDPIYLNEAKLYAYYGQYDMEATYSYFIQYYYGGDAASFWAGDLYGQGQTQQDMMKDSIMQGFYQTKVLCQEANAEGISLDDADQEKVTKAVENFMDEYAAVIEKAGADQALVEKMFQNNALANKMYESMVADIDTNLNADDMRRKNVEGIKVTALSSAPTTAADTTAGATEEDTTSVEENNEAGGEGTAETEEASGKETVTAETTAVETTEVETYSEQEKTDAVNSVLKDVQMRMEAGDSITDIVSSYTDDKYVTVAATGSITAAPTNAVEDGKEMTGYMQLAWSLSTDEYGSIVEGGTGYALHCVDDDDAELRADAEKTELANRKASMFEEKYTALQKKHTKFHVYDKVWASVKFTEAIYEADTTATTAATTSADSSSEESESTEEATIEAGTSTN